jgi:transcriptional regulator with XRE-family HTH domain
MASRGSRLELGLADARDLARVVSRELREARLAAGLSQATAARAAGMSASQWSRLERGAATRPGILQVCCAARVLGLRASVKLYPVASPLRDAGQLRVFERLLAVLGAPLTVQREIGLPIAADLRAWDAMITDGRSSCFADLETHITDAQALERRLRLKQRDDPRATVVLLVLARTDHHRRLLAEHREAFRDLLPLDSTQVLGALRAGRRPPASGIVLL